MSKSEPFYGKSSAVNGAIYFVSVSQAGAPATTAVATQAAVNWAQISSLDSHYSNQNADPQPGQGVRDCIDMKFDNWETTKQDGTGKLVPKYPAGRFTSIQHSSAPMQHLPCISNSLSICISWLSNLRHTPNSFEQKPGSCPCYTR